MNEEDTERAGKHIKTSEKYDLFNNSHNNKELNNIIKYDQTEPNLS